VHYASSVHPRHATWLGLALVAVGAFLPWAEIDVKEATAGADGLEALAAALASALTPVVEATAWNGRATVGTAKVPLWTILALDAAAALVAVVRPRSFQVPRAVAPVLAAAALALLVTFAVQAGDAAHLLGGFWVTGIGALIVLGAVLRGATGPSAEAGDAG
jgi:hypothetical protein